MTVAAGQRGTPGVCRGMFAVTRSVLVVSYFTLAGARPQRRQDEAAPGVARDGRLMREELTVADARESSSLADAELLETESEDEATFGHALSDGGDEDFEGESEGVDPHLPGSRVQASAPEGALMRSLFSTRGAGPEDDKKKKASAAKAEPITCINGYQLSSKCVPMVKYKGNVKLGCVLEDGNAWCSPDLNFAGSKLPCSQCQVVSYGSPDGSPTTAWLLLGMIGGSAMLLVLTNAPDPDVRKASWKATSSSLCVLCAILMFDVYKQSTDLMFSVKDNPKDYSSLLETNTQLEPSSMFDLGPAKKITTKMLVFAFARWLIAFAVLEGVLFGLRTKHKPLAGFGMLIAMFCGFAAADAFGYAQETPPWNTNVGLCFVYTLMVFFIMFIVCAAMDFVRAKAVGTDDHHWTHVCHHSEDEFVAFAAGLCLTQTVRFGVKGEVLHFHGKQENDNPAQVHALGAFIIVFALCSVGSMKLNDAMGGDNACGARLAYTVATVFSMSTAWTLLFWGKWSFWLLADQGDFLLAQVTMAFIFSFAGFAVIIGFDLIADRVHSLAKSLRFLSLGINLLIGLSWEAVFFAAIDECVGTNPTPGDRLKTTVMIALFCIIVLLPPWYLYILPHTLDDHDHHHEHGEGHHGEGGHAEGHGHEGDAKKEEEKQEQQPLAC
eukprot:TRINITY_DN11638_c0_g1_i2.p1 TRINITY_DN11638_c0_g1~~TRINITY_DN11638_c0_g1_i2.p1  ORF type:complete len:683 (-),score=142.13 TRINITY_DN11638_c0_g1_i2:118-2112(-)